MIYKTNQGLERTLRDISDGEEPWRKYRHRELFKTNNKCLFDLNSRFIVVYGDYQVITFRLSETKNKVEKMYEIDRDKFGEILALQLVSEDENNYRCDVACKLKSHT